MGFKIISDNYGNQRRISDTPDKTNIVLGLSKKKLSENNKITIKDDVNIKEDIIIKENIDTTIINTRDNTLHSCIKGIGSCKEKEDGSIWLYFGTYKSRVNFCPYCGFKAKGE